MKEKKEGGSFSQDDNTAIVQKIDAKMGRGWASKFANVLATDIALKADVTFTFEKLDAEGGFKYSSERKMRD